MDHMLVSPATLPHITDHQVLTHLAGSDHYPIQLQLDLQASPPPPRSKWQEHYKYRQIIPSQDPATIYRYQQLISDQQTWDGFCQLANDSSSTPDDLLDAFKMSIFTAAMTAGYRTKLMGLPKPAVSRTHSRYKAWHDGLCKQLQQEIKTLLQLQHIPEKAAELKLKQQEYRQRIKQLLRKHRAEHSRQQLQQWRNNRNTFWQAYRAHSSACPFPPTEIANHFSAKMNSYAPAPSSAAEQQHPPPRLGTIDITSTAPSVAAIIGAIRQMDLTTACGIDGIPPTLLHPKLPHPDMHTNSNQAAVQLAEAHMPLTGNAVAHIAAALHTVYQRISDSGNVPLQWCSALLVPIYKGKGGVGDMTSYRPLSIPSSACRLWSSMLNAKLMQATKEYLPDVMFGFRPHRSCSDALFVLRHLADMRKAKYGKLFATAFMDLSGAYDSIDRNLLFHKLQKHIGLSDHTLSTLRSLYNNTQCIVKSSQGTSQPFAVNCGLRQGCPLSTTLFNLFIHDMHVRLQRSCRDCGVRYRCAPAEDGSEASLHPLLTDLGYADDIALCANTPDQLQQLLNCFAAYCKEHALIINPSKCEVMVFAGNSRAMNGAVWFDGTEDQKQLARVHKFKYLGVELHGYKSIKAAVDHRLSRMIAAQSGVYRRLRDMHVDKHPAVVADLFDIMAGASGSYGCEIWSTPYLGDWHLLDCKLQQYQASVYKRCMGTKSSTSNLIAYLEMGKYPLQVQWLTRTVRYWNKLVEDRADSSLLQSVLQANVHHGLQQGAQCWSSELCAGLTLVCPEIDWRSHMLQFDSIDTSCVTATAKTAFCKLINQFTECPTAIECSTRQRSRYAQLMRPDWAGDQLFHMAYMVDCKNIQRIKTLAKYRTSGAPLRACCDYTTPYVERKCLHCNHHTAVEDDKHFLFECAATSSIRANARYTGMLAKCHTVEQLMADTYESDTASTVMHYVCDVIKLLGTVNAQNPMVPPTGRIVG
jgi:hypothetical protein